MLKQYELNLQKSEDFVVILPFSRGLIEGGGLVILSRRGLKGST